MKIVRFKDGRFGIRKTEFFRHYKFKDLGNNIHWWSIDSGYINDCKGAYEKVKSMFDNLDNLYDKGMVVNEITNELCYHPEESV